MKNLTNINVIKGLLEKYGFTFSKGLGQNFLINPSVCPKIAEYGFAQKGYGIIEIGTGFGTLSAELAKGADGKAFDTIEDAKSEILKTIKSGDVVLVKASHSMQFENIVEFLKQNF